MAGFSREVARRVFAEELRRSDLSFREGEDSHQYAPQYLLTPTGARCNRIFIVGTLTERDDIGGEAEYWRGRLVDPTGSILIYAGQYQPAAAQVLAGIEPPAFVAVVGKPSLYETEDGRKIVSIRAESVQPVDEATRNRWVMEAAQRTIFRLSLIRDACSEELSPGFQPGDAFSPQIPGSEDDAKRACHHYGTDIEEYRAMVKKALRSLDLSQTEPQPQEKPTVVRAKLPPTTGETASPSPPAETKTSPEIAGPLARQQPIPEHAANIRDQEKPRHKRSSKLVEEEEIPSFNFGKKG
ncbi:MAG TPA: hypothetical protein PLI05_09840 [Methanotrichaceae archaeon]|mgnify:CR=1 FL=1|nr:hypothetical protein [Methanotrichaceae archaeon]HQF17354.1 hypothetical protein [Methanotrichaceae archaeon]HQI91971.1 hypothetical protein [Methanotrichaceae archaeon]